MRMTLESLHNLGKIGQLKSHVNGLFQRQGQRNSHGTVISEAKDLQRDVEAVLRELKSDLI
jgi:hypothetical protein